PATAALSLPDALPIFVAAKEHAAESAAVAGSLAAIAVSALASSPLSHPATALCAALAAGLVVAMAPRPLRRVALPARTADIVLEIGRAHVCTPVTSGS